MKHYGDITKLNGKDLPVVDIIVGGSPCQDLSVAGKRGGLSAERSGLFMEQIRVIKEMRENDKANGKTNEFIRPRYMVWENVPGAFSSNGGEDFRIVLEETAKVIDPSTVIPKPPQNEWTPSGAIMGKGWSIAWRVHDAQFWGVPQRRRRIALVADFGGLTAPEILFERNSLQGNIEESGDEGQTTSRTTEDSTNESSGVKILNPSDSQGNQVASDDGTYPTLRGCGAAGYQQGYCLQTTSKTVEDDSASAVGFPLGFRAENTKCYDEKSTTLCNGTRPGFTTGVITKGNGSDTVNVEMEVSVRKYEVDREKLIECLQEHKKLSAKKIAKKLNKPVTLVEHWFRTDKYFAIPDADIWFKLKELLGIDTDEFDESITTFETKPGNYDMRNRIHMGEVAPTLSTQGENTLYCVSDDTNNPIAFRGQAAVEQGLSISDTIAPSLQENQVVDVCQNTKEPIMLQSNQNNAQITQDGVSNTLVASMGMGGGYVPMIVDDCLNPWDVQSKHIQSKNGVAESLYAGECRYGGGESYVLDEVKGNTYVDTDTANTLRARDYKQPQSVCCTFEPGAASRVGGHVYDNDVAGTVRANAGDNQQAVVYATQASGDRDNPTQSYQEGKAYTIPSNPMSDRSQAVVYGVCSYDSNAMKSDNPNSGFYEADTSRTLDNNGGNPACNQGGMAVVDVPSTSASKNAPMVLDMLNLNPKTDDVCQTLNAFNGTGGNNMPLVMESPKPIKDAVAFTQNQREEIRELGDVSGSIAAETGTHQQTYVLEGNGSRPSHLGNGYAESDVSYTLNSTEQHAVCYGCVESSKGAEKQNAKKEKRKK